MINFQKFFCHETGPLAFITGARFRLHIGGGSKSSSSQSTDASTKVTTTNQQVGASEGSTAFGANSRNEILGEDAVSVNEARDVTVQRVDDAIISAAGDALTAASITSVNAARDALNFGESALGRTLDSLDKANTNAQASQDSANSLVRQVNELFGTTVAQKSNDSATEVSKTAQRNMLIGFSVVIGGFIVYQIFKPSKN